MTRSKKSIVFVMVALATVLLQDSLAQKAMSPSDPVLEYDPANPPASPDWFHRIVKWVRTYGIAGNAVQNRNPGWNSDVYKAYAYGITDYPLAFRLEFPKNYASDPVDKKYPLIVFLHGQGENADAYKYPVTSGGPGSPNYDNHWQLLQGPPQFDAAIKAGIFDGFVLAPQLQNPYSGPKEVYYESILRNIKSIVDSLVANYKVDPFHIIVNGLSEGGVASWSIANMFPTYFAGVAPMSAPVDFVDWSNTGSFFSSKKYTSIWTSQGGKDEHPWPWETQLIVDTMAKYGANFRLSYFPNNYHDTWYDFWKEPNFWPFVNKVYSSNPWPLFGKSSFWVGQPINTMLGITPGFEAYEWRKNGTLISGTSNEIQVTEAGVYDARVKKRDGVWSDWSHVPVTVTSKNTYRKQAEDWSAMSGVQTESTTDAGGGRNVGWIDKNDWIDYTLGVVGDTTEMPAPYYAGMYTLDLRVAAQSAGAQFQIRSSDSVVLATVTVPQTSGWQNWQTVSVDIPLKAGVQNIRIKSISNTNFNINWIDFTLKSVQSPLPVNFVYFNAVCESNGGGVNLQWKTASEQNSSRFAVQRSVDGVNFSEVGSVLAAGQSSEERSYVYLDRSASASGSLYRIVEIDYSGKSTISSIIRSNCSLGTSSVSLYPNPSSGNSALNISLQQSSRVIIKVLDSRGALMLQKNLLLPAGSSSVPVDVSRYADGVYTISVHYNTESKTLKLIKK